MIWHCGRYWRFDGWAVRLERGTDRWFKHQRRGRFPGYVTLTDESSGEVRHVRSDCVMLNNDPV